MHSGNSVSERKLKNRKCRAPKGYAIRVSNLVFDTLNVRRRRKSWDYFFRRSFGLPDRAGKAQPLIEGMLEVITGMFVLKLSNATWDEVEQTTYKLADFAAKRRKIKAETPIRMRELR